MLGITEAIKEIAATIKEAFSYGTARTERQSEITVINNSKNAQKAINYAEQIIFLVDRFFFADTVKTEQLEVHDFEKEYFRLRKKFFKYN